MKRDMDLIRELLLKLEEYPKALEDVVHITPDAPGIQVAGYEVDQISYHLSLIEEAGLIDTRGAGAQIGIYFYRLSCMQQKPGSCSIASMSVHPLALGIER